jgi:hypothetical protein
VVWGRVKAELPSVALPVFGAPRIPSLPDSMAGLSVLELDLVGPARRCCPSMTAPKWGECMVTGYLRIIKAIKAKYLDFRKIFAYILRGQLPFFSGPLESMV